ncbi:hypothetical protein [Amycolatopsis keratiniphila]|uniref:hypothetical protein n=1 Tax=Amycolatopsis keratiniphila TaxID=129921 RepID=UPI000F4EAB94|nr:hypothetical protein [Amycolatopsis keratiniphila]
MTTEFRSRDAVRARYGRSPPGNELSGRLQGLKSSPTTSVRVAALPDLDVCSHEPIARAHLSIASAAV